MQNPCQDFFHILTGNIWKYGFAHFFHLEKYVKPLELYIVYDSEIAYNFNIVYSFEIVYNSDIVYNY